MQFLVRTATRTPQARIHGNQMTVRKFSPAAFGRLAPQNTAFSTASSNGFHRIFGLKTGTGRPSRFRRARYVPLSLRAANSLPEIDEPIFVLFGGFAWP